MKKILIRLFVVVLALALSSVPALAAPAGQEATPQPGSQTGTQQDTQPANQQGAQQPGTATGDLSQFNNPNTFALRASRLFGYRVVDMQGNQLGQVENFVLQLGAGNATGGSAPAGATGSADIRYLLVDASNGGRVAVPANAMQIDPQAGLFVTTVNVSDLQNAPGFQTGDLQQGAGWDNDLGAFWQERGVNLPQTNAAGNPVTARELIRYNLNDSNNQNVGGVDDLIVQFAGQPGMTGNPGLGQGQDNTANQPVYMGAIPVQSAVVRYAIVNATSQGRRAVPLSALTFNRDQRALTLDNRAALQDVPPLTGQAGLNNPNWDQDIEAYWVGLGFIVPGVSGAQAGNMMPSSLYYRASRLIGFPIIGTDNNELGEVEDIIVPIATQGQPRGDEDVVGIGQTRMGYALIGLGGFLGLGEEYVAIPFSQMRMHLVNPVGLGAAPGTAGAYGYPRGFGYGYYYGGYQRGVGAQGVNNDFLNQDAFMINMTQQDFDAAPRIDIDNIDLSNENWDADLRSFWQGRGVEYPQQSAGPALRVANVNGLFDYNLFGADEEDLGEVEDFLVHFQFAGDQNAAGSRFMQGSQIESASLRYALIQTGGFLGIGENSTIVPLSSMRVGSDEGGVDGFYLSVSEDQLDEAPDFNLGGNNSFRDAQLDDQFLPYWEQQGLDTGGTNQ